MKFLLSFCMIVLMSTVLAQRHTQMGPPSPGDFAGPLGDRGRTLLGTVGQHLSELSRQNKAHLIASLEYEYKLISALYASLHGKTNDEAATILIENEFTRLEHRIAEELSAIAYAHALPNDPNQSPQHLSTLATTLIETGKQVVDNFNTAANVKEIATIENEIRLLNQLITRLEAKPNGEELKREEQALVKHQQTMLHLIERVMAHDNHIKTQP